MTGENNYDILSRYENKEEYPLSPYHRSAYGFILISKDMPGIIMVVTLDTIY